MNRYNQLNHGPQGTTTLFVRIVTAQGRAALEFASRGSGACLADIVGVPQVVTQAPKRFYLTNFRYENDPGLPCVRRIQPTPWRGALTLSADPDGDLSFSLVLDQAMDTGAPWFEFTAQDLPFPNRMTPRMAVADASTKQQMAAANAERARQAAAARAEAQARLDALPHASPVYARQMARYVEKDSLGWAINRLAPGSVGNVRVYSGSVKSGDFVLRAEFRYSDGSPGWAVAQYVGGRFNCIQFWDIPGCRTLLQPGERQQTLASVLNSASDSGGSSQSGESDHDRSMRNAAEFQNWQQHQPNN